MNSMVADLVDAYRKEQEDYKPSMLANARYVETIPCDSGKQFGVFATLKIHGRLTAPVPQVGVLQRKEPNQGTSSSVGTTDKTPAPTQAPTS